MSILDVLGVNAVAGKVVVTELTREIQLTPLEVDELIAYLRQAQVTARFQSRTTADSPRQPARSAPESPNERTIDPWPSQ